MKLALVAVVLPVLLVLAACGAKDAPEPSAPLDAACAAAHAEAPTQKILWAMLLSGAHRAGSNTQPVQVKQNADGSTVETHAVSLPPPGEAHTRQHLQGIEYPGSRNSIEAVRCYAATVLRRGIETRTVFSSINPEVDLLAPVARDHPGILVEAVVHADLLGADSHVIWALERAMREGDKQLVIDALDDAPCLVAVVGTRGWAKDAAPALLRGLESRSRYLLSDWVTAAAQVAGPAHYEDLRFQMAEGQDPVACWLAIRDLPRMEPLDDFVDATWQRITPEEYHDRWYEFAVIAAHYGHVDALMPFAQRLPETRRWWDLFTRLTGFGGGREDAARYSDAADWVARNQGRFEFDAAELRYRVNSQHGR